MKKYIFLLAFITLLLYSCSTIYTSVDYDRKANFSALKTYAFHEKGLNELKLNDIDKSRVKETIISNLATKGFTQANENYDFTINIQAYNKEKVNINYDSYNFGFGYGWGFGWNLGFNRPNVHQYQEGFLVISVVDTKTNILIWEGIAGAIRTERNDKKQEQIPEAVNKMLNKFPPKA